MADKLPSVERMRAEAAELRFKADELMQLASALTEEAVKLEDMISRYGHNQKARTTGRGKRPGDSVQLAKKVLAIAHRRS